VCVARVSVWVWPLSTADHTLRGLQYRWYLVSLDVRSFWYVPVLVPVPFCGGLRGLSEQDCSSCLHYWFISCYTWSLVIRLRPSFITQSPVEVPASLALSVVSVFLFADHRFCLFFNKHLFLHFDSSCS